MERLLLVEHNPLHNPLFREGLATLLEWRTGLSSVQAGSMAEAKGVLEEANQKPACIIVDLDLPDGEGNELLEQLDRILVLALIKDRSLQRQAEERGGKTWNPRSQPKTPHTMMPLVAAGPRVRLV